MEGNVAKLSQLLILMICIFSLLNSYGQIKDIDFWQKKFDFKWSKDSLMVNDSSLKSDSWSHYSLGYSIDGLTAMYIATEKETYLRNAMELINNVINTAKCSRSIQTSQYRDKYYGWVNMSNPFLKNDGKEYSLYESYCWRNITQLLRVMHKHPKLLKKEKYRLFFNKVLDFSEVNIFEKWESRGKNNIYRSNAHMFSHWARISMDLWEITKNKKYYKVFDDFNKKLNSQILKTKKRNNAFGWFTSWRKGNVSPQDVSHGNAVVSEIIEAYDLQLAYNKATIDGLIVVFDKYIWRESNNFAKYIDGSGKGNGWFSDGFIKLGRYNEHLQKRIETHSIGRSLQFYGNGCLNVYYLKKIDK